jgi:uncharacterized repeat protein (TIGR01451 family)
MSAMGRRPVKAAIWAACAALTLLASGNASAAGTNAGTSVSNSFTLDYQVGGVAQTQISTAGAPTTFTVDRKVDATVSAAAGATVSPGQTGAEIVLGVTNNGNDNVAFRLSLKDTAVDTFDIGTYAARYYADAGNDGIFTPGVDDAGAGTSYTLGAGTTSDVAPDATIWVVLSGDVPASAANGQTDDVILIADAYYPAASLDAAYSAAPGTEILQAGANAMNGEADSVLADGAGSAGAPEDVANDGAHSATATYSVSAAALTASKTVAIVATVPTNCATDAIAGGFAAPGACVEYVITAANAAAASATATNIDINDVLPDEVQFVSAAQSGFSVAGSLSTPGGACASACTVALTGASLAPGATGTITIRARVR